MGLGGFVVIVIFAIIGVRVGKQTRQLIGLTVTIALFAVFEVPLLIGALQLVYLDLGLVDADLLL